MWYNNVQSNAPALYDCHIKHGAATARLHLAFCAITQARSVYPNKQHSIINVACTAAILSRHSAATTFIFLQSYYLCSTFNHTLVNTALRRVYAR